MYKRQHLHSFSASDFKIPGRGWSSALLEKGADVTVGNEYEPFLGACHRFDIFADRLLDGYTVAEATWMSMPVLSWQGVVFGDPLYRPYARMKDMDVKPCLLYTSMMPMEADSWGLKPMNRAMKNVAATPTWAAAPRRRVRGACLLYTSRCV